MGRTKDDASRRRSRDTMGSIPRTVAQGSLAGRGFAAARIPSGRETATARVFKPIVTSQEQGIVISIDIMSNDFYQT
jgi:hypothetical protein